MASVLSLCWHACPPTHHQCLHPGCLVIKLRTVGGEEEDMVCLVFAVHLTPIVTQVPPSDSIMHILSWSYHTNEQSELWRLKNCLRSHTQPGMDRALSDSSPGSQWPLTPP